MDRAARPASSIPLAPIGPPVYGLFERLAVDYSPSRISRPRRNLPERDFKSLYLKRANTPRSRTPLLHRASDTTLGLPARNNFWFDSSTIVLFTADCLSSTHTRAAYEHAPWGG